MDRNFEKNIRPFLSKCKFAAGLDPVIIKTDDWRKFIPPPYQAVVTITADFELAWAWRYAKKFSNPYQMALEKARLERTNVKQILSLCDKYEIPVTWATVGHLFLDRCEKINGKGHPDLLHPRRFENKYTTFNGGDWYQNDPCTNLKDAPEWYGADLIQMILDSKVKHEIGCHTFSHIDCRNEVCPPELFTSEIDECQTEAEKFGLKLKSFVHPGYTIGNLNTLAELGFSSFQTDEQNTLGYPVKHDNGLWELKRTYEFVPRKNWSIEHHIYRYKKVIDRAIKHHAVCNFWFHPSFSKRFLTNVLAPVFEYLQKNKSVIYLSTVNSYLTKCL